MIQALAPANPWPVDREQAGQQRPCMRLPWRLAVGVLSGVTGALGLAGRVIMDTIGLANLPEDASSAAQALEKTVLWLISTRPGRRLSTVSQMSIVKRVAGLSPAPEQNEAPNGHADGASETGEGLHPSLWTTPHPLEAERR